MRFLFAGLVWAAASVVDLPAKEWLIPSANSEQTFAYGSERHRQWIVRNGHLALVMEFTNDPYVDKIETRQFDDFEFEFPNVRRGFDGKTFYFRPNHQTAIPVASIRPGLGLTLLPTSSVIVQKVHGLITILLVVIPS
jgi:hypothetical protein